MNTHRPCFGTLEPRLLLSGADPTIDSQYIMDLIDIASAAAIGGLQPIDNTNPGSNNFLIGTNSDDNLDGRGNDDVLMGLGGNDRLRGQGGQDVLFGGSGDDELLGHGGDGHLIYQVVDNYNGSQDVYDGGGSSDKVGDTLWLVTTHGEYKAFKSEIENVQGLLQAPKNNKGISYDFDSFGLSIENIENIECLLTNRGPTAVDDSIVTNEDSPITTSDLRSNDIDLDHMDELSVIRYDQSSLNGAEVSFVGNGVFNFNPNNQYEHLAIGEISPDSFTYTISDLAGVESTATVNVTVTGVNDTPVVIEPLVSNTNEDAAIYSIDLLAGASDVDNGAVLNAQGVTEADNKGGWAVAGNSLTVNPDYFTSLAVGESETLNLSYQVVDEHGASVAQTLTVTITGLNDVPVVAAALGSATNEDDAPYTIDLLAGASDVDNGAVLNAQGVTEADNKGGWTVAGNSLTVNPDYFTSLAVGESETLNLSYQVVDEHGASVAQTLTVTITGSNDVPVVAAALVSATNEDDAPYTIDLIAGASDVDNGAVLNAQGVTEADNKGGWTVAGNSLTVNPDYFTSLAVGESETLNLSYQVVDEHGASVAQTLTVTITGSNDVPVVSAALSSETTEDDAPYTIDLIAGASDVDNGAVLNAQGVTETDGKGGWTVAGNSLTVNPDYFTSLAVGESETLNLSYQVVDEHGASVAQTLTVTITGSNDVPVVAAALSSETTEDDAPYTIDLIAGASDVDNGAILNAQGVTEADNKGGWTVSGNTITIDPSFYDDMNDGEFETLTFNYQVIDEHGAAVDQSLTVDIEGITDAPSLSVTTAAGDQVNEVRLIVTSQPAKDERVELTFANLPDGAVVLDQDLNDVTAGISDYLGTQTFTVVLPEGVDIAAELSVTATGVRANGEIIGETVQVVELVYGVASSIDMVTFNSVDQNMWGTFDGNIGWHEYVPFIGEAPIVWNADTQAWEETGADYWRSGEFSLIDARVDSIEFLETVAQIGQDVLDAAWQVFLVSSTAVDQAALFIFNTAKDIYEAARDLFYDTASAVDQVALDIFNTARAAYDAAYAAFHAAVGAVDQAALNVFKAAESAYEIAKTVFEAADYAFNYLAQGAFNGATSAIRAARRVYNSISDAWWNQIAKGIGWLVLQAAEGLYDLAEAAYDVADDIWDGAVHAFDVVAQGAYNAAKAAYDAAKEAFDQAAAGAFALAEQAFLLAEATYEGVKQGIYDAADAIFALAEEAFLVAEGVYEAVKQGIYDAAAAGMAFVETAWNDAIAVASAVDFVAELTLDAELFAQAGLQVDFELDLGSVDTEIDYQLTSQTQYNQTTDMLLITPTMTNLTNGESVAFSTISPNATFYAAILYDVGADIDLFIDGHLWVGGLQIFDLSPDSEGINLSTTLSTNSWDDILAAIPEAFRPELTDDIGSGELVLIDFDSTEGGPWELPFIESLTADVLSIELDFPTIETEGQAADYSLDYFQEGPFVTVDMSEITDSFLNLVNAKLDFSDELKELYDLPSLGDAATLGEAISSMASGIMAQIWDMLDGHSEAVPIFVLDATDETSSSLLHVNLFSDDAFTSDINADTASLGFYAAYGESDPIVKVNIDIDAAVAVIVNKVLKAAAAAATAGAGSVLEAIPIINPLNIEFGIQQILEMAQVPEAQAQAITDYIDLGFTIEAADLDAFAAADFSQEFTLSIDDMSYLLTLENGDLHCFTANDAGDLLLSNASQYDLNNDGTLEYNLEILPTAMFSNDTEVGLSLGYQLDFLKGGFVAAVNFPLGELLGLGDDSWLNIELSMLDISIGPMLRIQGDLDVLDVDVFESRFVLDVGSDELTGGVDIALSEAAGAPV